MRWVAAAALCLAFVGRAGADPALDAQPTMEIVKRIEAIVQMPDPRWPLTDYDRFYAGEGPATIRGVYILKPTIPGDHAAPGETRAHIVSADKLIAPLDGGCAVITLEYDLARRVITRSRCNGVG